MKYTIFYCQYISIVLNPYEILLLGRIDIYWHSNIYIYIFDIYIYDIYIYISINRLIYALVIYLA